MRARCTPTRLVSNLERGHTRRGGTQRQRSWKKRVMKRLDKKKRKKKRGKGQTGVWELAGPTCLTQTSLVSFLLVPSASDRFACTGSHGSNTEDLLPPSKMRVARHYSRLEFEFGRAAVRISGCVGRNDRGRLERCLETFYSLRTRARTRIIQDGET